MFIAIFLGGGGIVYRIPYVMFSTGSWGGGSTEYFSDVLHMISVDWAYHNFRRCFEHCFIPAVVRSSGLINYEQL